MRSTILSSSDPMRDKDVFNVIANQLHPPFVMHAVNCYLPFISLE